MSIVRDALTLLVCSRHGLRESELLELMAPPGKSQLPGAVWTRLYRSLELYLRPLGEEEQGMLGFFHTQMAMAVRKRYLQVRGDTALLLVCLFVCLFVCTGGWTCGGFPCFFAVYPSPWPV